MNRKTKALDGNQGLIVRARRRIRTSDFLLVREALWPAELYAQFWVVKLRYFFIFWGFAVLIPWAAIQGNLYSNVLWCCWLATIFWTFGFDTIYALADKKYDLEIGINSSPIHLKSYTKITIQICYLLTSIFLGATALIKDASYLFRPIWLITTTLMQRDTLTIFKTEDHSISKVSIHFRNQVIYGSLFLLGIIISN